MTRMNVVYGIGSEESGQIYVGDLLRGLRKLGQSAGHGHFADQLEKTLRGKDLFLALSPKAIALQAQKLDCGNVREAVEALFPEKFAQEIFKHL